MSEKQIARSPIEPLTAEFRKALGELGVIEGRRNEVLAEWAAARTQLARQGPRYGRTTEFERLTALLREVNEQFVEAQRRVRRLDHEMGEAQARWSAERHRDSRPQV
jgi:hypothetical protein